MNTDQAHTLEETLSGMRPEASNSFKRTLRAEVLGAAVGERRLSSSRIALVWARAWMPLVLVFVLTTLMIFLTPTGRALAQKLLQIGIYFVTDEPTDAERWIDSPPKLRDVVTLTATRVYPGEVNTQSIAGFPVYYPTYLPDGYHPFSDPPVELAMNSKGQVLSAEVMFVDESGDHVLYLKQYPINAEMETEDIPLEIGGAPAERVTVNGQEGLWLQDFAWGTVSEPDAGEVVEKYNLLVWTEPAEQGTELYYWLGSQEQLPMAELVRVAESLALDSPDW